MAAWFAGSGPDLGQLGEWLGRGAVALGLLRPEEVLADPRHLSSEELARRFVAEACELKQRQQGKKRGAQKPFLLTCSAADFEDDNESDAQGGASLAIDDTLRSWLMRLDTGGSVAGAEGAASSSHALQALLQSKALDVLLSTLARGRAGRAKLRAAAREAGGGGRDIGGCLLAVLIRCSEMPPALLSELLDLLGAAAETATLGRDEQLGDELITSADADVDEQTMQWAMQLCSAALSDDAEVALQARSRPVAAVEAALEAMAADGAVTEEAGPEQLLNAADGLSNSFRHLRGHAERLATTAPEQQSLISHDGGAATRSLDSKLMLLASLRTSSLGRSAAQGATTSGTDGSPSRGVSLLLKAATCSTHVEDLLRQRRDKAAALAGRLTDVLGRHTMVAAACLESERLRRQKLEGVIAGLHKALWCPDAPHLARRPDECAAIRGVISRSIAMVDEAWRQMVALAADSLDENNLLSANSEDMSAAATRYKGMRQELQALLTRLGKVEEMEPPPPKAPAREASSSNSPVAARGEASATSPAGARTPPKVAATGASSSPSSSGAGLGLGLSPPPRPSTPVVADAAGGAGSAAGAAAAAAGAAAAGAAAAAAAPAAAAAEAAAATAAPAAAPAAATGGVQAASTSIDVDGRAAIEGRGLMLLCPPTYWKRLYATFPDLRPAPRDATEAVAAVAAPVATAMLLCPASYWEGLHARFERPEDGSTAPAASAPASGSAPEAAPEAAPPEAAPPAPVPPLGPILLCPPSYWQSLHAQFATGADR